MAKSDSDKHKTSNGPSEGTQKMEAVKLRWSKSKKQYGRGSIMRFGDTGQKVWYFRHLHRLSPPRFSTRSRWSARGRIIEIYGPEASGKTTICLSIIAQAQKHNGVAAFIDAEHALDPLWAERIGVKLDELLISQPDTGEQALEIAESLIRSGGIDVLVIDSVAALVPRAEIEGRNGRLNDGFTGTINVASLRKLTAVISKSKTVVIFTNQLRQKIGVMFGNPKPLRGDSRLSFIPRADGYPEIESLKEGDRVIGSRHRVKVR